MRIINPATNEILQEIAEDDAASIHDKFERAKLAQRAWSARSLADRLRVARSFRELVVEQTDELARTLTSEVGKPITQAKNELKGLLGRIDFFLDHAPQVLADDVVLDAPAEKLRERLQYEPLGVIANISAWNYPYFVGANVFVPALLAGNAVLYKPSEFATLTGLHIARLLREAGAPNGVFETVIGGGDAGARLLDERVSGVYFTGSYETGRKIATHVAPRLIPVQLELGGKDPAYVADDVEPGSAAAAVADGAFYNAGQSCCAVERVYVHEALWEPFVEAFINTVRGFTLGDPLDPSTYLGPLARREAQLELLEAQVADATGKGAELLLGGKRAERAGFYFEPTVLVNVSHDMAVMREESFGPIIGLMKVRSDRQAAELMADTQYGLTASVYTADRTRAEQILSQLDVGSAYWNCCDRVSPRLPWSGRKQSGIGCTLGIDGIRAFVRPKAWHLRG